jgi:cytochrome c oxidase subunit II
MRSILKLGALIGAVLTFFIGNSGQVLAQEGGQPQPWQMGLSDPASPLMERIQWFHDDFLLIIITVITLFVTALLIYCMIRFNARANPVPTKTSHNALLEVAWTVIPILILVAIAIPSFKLLYFDRTIPEVDLTIKATGNQWYWSYEYQDEATKGIEFDSVMLEDDELKPGQPRLLAVDNNIVVPVNKVVKVVVTASDVIHDFAMPAFGLKMDAVPGRLNETWFKSTQTGMFYGQCSELCGVRHAFMPIAIKVVSEEEFKQWVVKAKKEFANIPAASEKINVAMSKNSVTSSKNATSSN